MAERDPGFRRIVVGLDASPASLDALAAAALLAGRLRTDLAGLFVEDEDLLRLAGLPFAGVVRVPSGVREGIDRPRAEAELRALAAQAREALERAASAQRVACTFRVARGGVVAEVLAAAEEADLLVVGAGGHRRSGTARAGDTARAAAARARSSVLVLRRGGRLGDPIVAVDDGTPGAARAAAVARALSGEPGPTLVEAPAGDPGAVAAVLARLRPALVVVPAGGRYGSGSALDAILSAGAAALLVR
ncbi:MAG TPA: universal stress protein [Anaeromyxobacter sp.]|nr:universal stress protein [Anaeromyxobacter sp.]